MTRPMQRRRIGLWGGGALVVAWLVFIVVSINNEPPGGASTLDALKNDTATTLHDQDAESLQLLFDSDTVADDYASSYLKKLGTPAARDTRVTVKKVKGARFVVAAGPGTCTAWQVLEKDDRWYLDGTPPVLGGTLCGSGTVA